MMARISRILRTSLAIALLLSLASTSSAVTAPPPDPISGDYYTIAAWPSDARVFASPSGVAVDSSGYLYVADTRNNVVKKLSPSGDVLAAWGGRGSGPGEFNEPAAVAVGGSGAIYVADTANNRVQVLSPDGSYLREWGESGSGNGDFARPAGIAVDASENVFVSDTWNGRIQKFSSAGSFLSSWGSTGPGNGEFDSPQQIAIGPDGSVYVADLNNRRIQKFDGSGTYVTQWGPVAGGGTDPSTSRYEAPYGVWVSAAGVFVADGSRSIIEKCSDTGALLGTYGTEGSGAGQFLGPRGVAVDATGTVYVADTRNNRVALMNTSGIWQGAWDSGGTGPGELSSAEDVSLDETGSVYIADTGNHRIQRLSSEGVFDIEIGSFGSGAGQLDTPNGVAVGASGKVFVADTGNHRIQTFDASGTATGSFGTFGTSAGAFDSPKGVATAPDGTLWVGDSGNDRIQHFTAAGVYLGGFGVSGAAAGQLDDPRDIAVDASGTVYVCDTGNNRVQRFTSAGTYIDSWGTWGTAEGMFRAPAKLALGPGGDVFVADAGNDRVQRFTADGAFRVAIGEVGAELGQMRWPSGVTVDAAGRVMVAERDNQRVQVFGHDEAAPTTSAFGIPVGFSNQPVTVTLNATDDASGVETTYYRLGVAGEDTTYTAPFTITAQGNTQVRFWSVDRIGQVEAIDSDNIATVRIDSQPPQGTFDLDGGIAYATTTTVTADSAMDEQFEMRFDTGAGYGSWVPYSATATLTLPGEGTQTVFAQYSDFLNNIATKTDSITVDWTPPISAAVGVSTEWVVGPVDVTLEASDTVSGVATTYFSVAGAAPATYTAPVNIAVQGETEVAFWSVDMAGNAESTASVTVRIDSIPPSGSLALEGGATYATSHTLGADSSVTGAVEMRFDAGGGFGPWVAYAASHDVTVTADGEHTVTAQYRDDASNVFEASDTIIVDTLGAVVDRIWARGDTLETTGSAVTIGFEATDENGADAFSWVIDAHSETTPDTLAEVSGVDVREIASSVGTSRRYIHVRARDAAGNWGETTHMELTFRSAVSLGAPIAPRNLIQDEPGSVFGGFAGTPHAVVIEAWGWVAGEWVEGPTFVSTNRLTSAGWIYEAPITLPRGHWTLRARSLGSVGRVGLGEASAPIRVR